MAGEVPIFLDLVKESQCTLLHSKGLTCIDFKALREAADRLVSDICIFSRPINSKRTPSRSALEVACIRSIRNPGKERREQRFHLQALPVFDSERPWS